MNIISSLGNQFVQDNLKNSYPEIEFLLPDLSYQEGILEALQNNSPDAVIINLPMDVEGRLMRFASHLSGALWLQYP